MPVVVVVCTRSVASASAVAVAVAVASHRTGSQSYSGQAAGSLAFAQGKARKTYHLVVGVAGLGCFGFAGGGTSDRGMQERRTAVEGCSYRSAPHQTLCQY